MSTLLQQATAQTASTMDVRAHTENAVAGLVRAEARIRRTKPAVQLQSGNPTPLSLAFALMQP